MEITVKKIGAEQKEYIEIGCHVRDGRINDIVRFVENLDGNISGTKGEKKYAIPVTEIPMSVPLTPLMPVAISRAVSSLTAPYCSRVSGLTPSSCIFASLLYVTIPRSKHSDIPGTSVSAAENIPPVQDSAQDMVSFLSISFCDTTLTRSSLS